VKQAILANIGKVKAVTEANVEAASKASGESMNAPKTNPLVLEVMRILDGNASGTIQRREFQEALVEVVNKKQLHLDVGALVEGIYDQHKTLTRSNIRTALEHNSEEIRNNLIEPIQNQIMRSLETVSGSEISKTNLGEALLQIQDTNGVEMTLAGTKNLVRLIFSQMDAT
jgi:hypothetical protein